MKHMATIKKERVRKIILDAKSSSNLVVKMELIDTLERIGVAYHYREDINEILCDMHGDEQGIGDDLHTTAMRFYLLRKHGYHTSTGIITAMTVNLYIYIF